MTQYDDVKEFHAAFDLTIAETPQIPDLDTVELRRSLINEESVEVDDVLADMMFFEYNNERHPTPDEQKDLICNLAKELADLIYVVNGCAITFGIDLNAVFEEVHKSNMTKVPKDGVILRREDGKVLKPDTYTPANVEKVLYR